MLQCQHKKKYMCYRNLSSNLRKGLMCRDMTRMKPCHIVGDGAIFLCELLIRRLHGIGGHRSALSGTQVR